MQRRHWKTTLAVLIAMLLASTAHAQVKKEEVANFAITGEITAIDAEAGTVTVKGANDDGGVYEVNAMTTIMSGNSGITLSDLKAGQQVVLNGNLKGEAKVATYIEIVDAPASD